jgi:hypothetical protein
MKVASSDALTHTVHEELKVMYVVVLNEHVSQ